MGLKAIRYANRKTGGGLGAAFFALLLAIGLYLLPIGQDLIWAKLYQLADENVWKAWLYLYLLSLGFITLGYWGLSAKRAKITYSARKYGVLLLAIAVAATAMSTAVTAEDTIRLKFPALEQGELRIGEHTIIPFVIECDFTPTVVVFYHNPSGWWPRDAFDNPHFFLASDDMYKYDVDKLQIQVKSGGSVLKYYEYTIIQPKSVPTKVDATRTEYGINYVITGASLVWQEGYIYAVSPVSPVSTLSDATPGLHLAAAVSETRDGAVYVSSDDEYVPSAPGTGGAEIHFVSPSDGANVNTHFTATVNLTFTAMFPVQEVRFGYDDHQVDNPIAIVDVSGPDQYSADYDLTPGTHHLHAYAVDYDVVQPIGAGDYHPPPGYNFRIIRAEDHIDVMVNEGSPDYQPEITAPADGDTLQGGSSFTITWNQPGAGAPDHYEISIVTSGEPASWQDVGTVTSYTWTVPDGVVADFDISVKAVYGDGEGVDTITVHVVTTASISVDSPISGETYTGGIPVVLSTSVDVDSITVKASPGPGTEYRQTYYPTDGRSVNDFMELPAGIYTVTVEAFLNSVEVANATVDDVHVVVDADAPPELVITTPRDGDVVGHDFTIEWTVTAGTPTSITIEVTDAGGLVTQFNVDPGATSAEVHVSHNRYYTVTVTAASSAGSGSDTITVYAYDGHPEPQILTPGAGENVQNPVIIRFEWGIAPNLRDHMMWKIDDGDWHTENSTGFQGLSLWLSEGSHSFTMKVYDIYGNSETTSVSFIVSGDSSGGGFWNPGEGDSDNGIPKEWLILGGLVVLALIFGGKRRR